MGHRSCSAYDLQPFCSAYDLQPFSTSHGLLMAQADDNEIKPPPENPAEDLETPEMQYFINIAPLPPGKPCNPSSQNQVVIFLFFMAFIICFFLWAMGHSLYRGWRLRKQQELETTLSNSVSVAFANSDGIPPLVSVLPTDNSPVIPPPISVLPTDNSLVIPPSISVPQSDNIPAIPHPISVLPSAPPLEALACHRCGYPECNILPLQLVCPCCGNMWPLNAYTV